MTRPSSHVRFTRSVVGFMADHFAQCAIEGHGPWIDYADEIPNGTWQLDRPARAQAYYDLKKRLNAEYGRGIATAFVSGEYGKFSGDTSRQAFAREYMQEVVPPTPEEYEKAIRDGKVWPTPRTNRN